MSSLEERTSEGRVGANDDRPLTEQEQQQVRRLLSDPFVFPISFKTWLVSYLESSDVSFPIGSVSGLKNILGVAGVGGGILGVLPAGIVFEYGGTVAPAGSLMCDGASYLRTSYSRLFDVIGTRYGSVDVNHFNVPNRQKRVGVGLDPTDVDFNTLGKIGGEKEHTLTAAEYSHQHGSLQVQAGTGAFPGQPAFAVPPGASTAAPHNNMPPFLVMNYIIVA